MVSQFNSWTSLYSQSTNIIYAITIRIYLMQFFFFFVVTCTHDEGCPGTEVCSDPETINSECSKYTDVLDLCNQFIVIKRNYYIIIC